MVAKKPVAKKPVATKKVSPKSFRYSVTFAIEYEYFVKAKSADEAEGIALREFWRDNPLVDDDPRTVEVRKVKPGEFGY